MPQTSKKIVIIGAGPIGCYTAQLLKLYGYDPLVIEEHGEVGKPVHCTGLVGSRVFEEERRYPVPHSSIINVINGAVIHYDDQSFHIERKKVAYVIERQSFDKELSRSLRITFNNRFLGLERAGAGYIIETDKDQLSADIVIGADGPNSIMRRILNPDAHLQCYKGVQLRMRTKLEHKDLVEVYLKKPSFFWIVPESEDTARIGTISENPYKDLQLFLKEINLKGEIIERFGGLVSIGICSTTVKDNIAVVGDAACQMKPLTYGGIYFGLKAAHLLSECVRDGRLDEYDALWKRELAMDIRIGLKVRDIYDGLTHGDLQKIFGIVKRQKSLIEKRGDFENHSSLVLEIIKNPSLYPQLGELLPILLKNIL